MFNEGDTVLYTKPRDARFKEFEGMTGKVLRCDNEGRCRVIIEKDGHLNGLLLHADELEVPH